MSTITAMGGGGGEGPAAREGDGERPGSQREASREGRGSGQPGEGHRSLADVEVREVFVARLWL